MVEIRKGDVVKNYKLEKMIGSGGFTTVYQAVNLSPHFTEHSIVAVKILHDRRKNIYDIKTFEQSAKLSLSLKHKNIIEVYDFFQQNGDYFMFMELLDFNLNDFLRKNPDTPMPHIIGVLQNVAEGLKYIHHNGIVHKDVKESNILVSHNLDKIKITDFGLAKKLNLNRWGRISSFLGRDVGKLSGTEGYVAPEEIQAKKSIYDKRTDIYAFGKTIEKVFQKTGAEKPFKIETLIKKATKENPGERFQTMEEMFEYLNSF
jgi:serine/threonine protein kinase